MDGAKHGRIKKNYFKREEGFILPVTLIVLFFFSALILYQVTQLTIDRKFMDERKLLVKETELKKIAARDIVDQIDQTSNQEFSEDRHYPLGTVSYHVLMGEGEVYKVEATLSLSEQQRATFQFSYDKSSSKIIRWLE